MVQIAGLIAAHPLLLQAAEETAEKSQSASGFGSWTIWVLIAVMIGVFYFLLIRPQRKRQQEHESLISRIEKGDEIVTIGGIHGTVKKVTDDSVVMEIDKGVRLTISRSAISKTLTPHEEEEEEEPEEEAGEEEDEDMEEYEEEFVEEEDSTDNDEESSGE